jgi:hypothetical protein
VPPARWRYLATHRINYDAKPWAIDRSATKPGAAQIVLRWPAQTYCRVRQPDVTS